MSETIWNDLRITAYIFDELSADERAAFEEEINANSELAAAVDEARGITKQLAGLFSDEPTPPLDSQRRQFILATETGAATDQRPARSWNVPLVALAIAATLLLLVGVPAALNRQSTLTQSTLTQQSRSSAGDRDEPVSERRADVAVEPGRELVETLARDSNIAPFGERGLELAEEYSRSTSETAPTNLSSQLSAEGLIKQLRAGDNRRQLEVSFEEQSQSGSQHSPIVMQREHEELESRGALGDVDGLAQMGASGRGGAIVADGEQVKYFNAGSRGVIEEKLGELADSDHDQFWGESGARVAGPTSGAPRPAANPAEMGGYGSAEHPYGEVAASADVSGQPNASQYRFGMDRTQPADDSGATSDKKGIGMGIAPVKELGRGGAERLEQLHQPTPTKALEGHMGGYGGETKLSVASRARRIEPQVAESLFAGANVGREIRGRDGGINGMVPDYGLPIDEGRGPGIAGDRFEPITDNPFKRVAEHPLSTFSVDVDTASYSKVRDFLVRANQLPRPDAVRIEELVNYFDYDYEAPAMESEHPFAAHVEVTSCPWNSDHKLARFALKGKQLDPANRPDCNLVFLLDTSGSMNAPNKLPLVQQGMKMLLKQLDDEDRVAIVVYAGSAGMVLDSTLVSKKRRIRRALTELAAGGSTNGGAGIALAYQTARDNFITGGVNRVILCTDGDFNVGTTGTDELVRMVEREAQGGVFLSVLGFGMGNHNDSMLEQVSGRGNGNYAFIDTDNEARKVLVEQTDSTLVTIAKDVKLQIEFNPLHVSSYRLIGYENRVLAKEDFNDDKKDAGEIGAGHSVTALYELVPAGVEADAARPEVDPLRYQSTLEQTDVADSGELLTLKLRYKQPDGDTSTLVEFPIKNESSEFTAAGNDVRFAAAVAGFGMQLRRSPYAGDWTMSNVLQVAKDASGEDRYELRAEFVELVQKAANLMGQEK